jgi:hypothetical protein
VNTQRIHYSTSLFNSLKIIFWILYEPVIHLPAFFSLKKFYKTRKKDCDIPSVAIVGDNLDEINGIALHGRTLVRTMRQSNRPVYLIGIAFHTKKARMEVPSGSIFMIPARCSMDLPGYRSIEIAVPKIDLMLRLLRKYPIDLLEIETPGPAGFMALVVGKIIGIKTVAHFRTDVASYARTLAYAGPSLFPHRLIKKEWKSSEYLKTEFSNCPGALT